jgi:nucleoside-diphosphate-sugar epimerase
MIVVYGATGFIGEAVQVAASNRGKALVGFGRESCVMRMAGTPPKLCRATSKSERLSIIQSLPRPSAMIFTAGAAIAATSPHILAASHLGSLRDAIELLPDALVDDLRFVYASSGRVYRTRCTADPIRETDPAKPDSSYGQIKLDCEELIRESATRLGVRVVIARLFSIIGRGNRGGIVYDVARQAVDIRAKKRAAFRLRSNIPIMDFTHVNEAAEALLRLTEVKELPLVVNVCSGRASTTSDLICAARAMIGDNTPVNYDDDRGPSEALVGCPDLIFTTTGWRAQKSLDWVFKDVVEGLRDEVET